MISVNIKIYFILILNNGYLSKIFIKEDCFHTHIFWFVVFFWVDVGIFSLSFLRVFLYIQKYKDIQEQIQETNLKEKNLKFVTSI